MNVWGTYLLNVAKQLNLKWLEVNGSELLGKLSQYNFI